MVPLPMKPVASLPRAMSAAACGREEIDDPVPKAIKVHGKVLLPDGSGWQEPPQAAPPVPVVRELKPGMIVPANGLRGDRDRGSGRSPTPGKLLRWPWNLEAVSQMLRRRGGGRSRPSAKSEIVGELADSLEISRCSARAEMARRSPGGFVRRLLGRPIGSRWWQRVLAACRRILE